MNCILFDVESTGLVEPQIVEWAFAEVKFPIRPDGELFDSPDIKSGRCRPSKPIEYGALATHGILDWELEDEPPASEFRLPDGVEYVAGWNIDFDVSALPYVQSDLKAIDLEKIARRFWPDCDCFSLAAILYRLFGRCLGVKAWLSDAHSAAQDVSNLNRILGEAALHQPQFFGSVEELFKLSQECRIPEIFPFGKFKGRPVSEVDNGWRKWYHGVDDQDPWVLKAFEIYKYGCQMPDPNRYAVRSTV